MSVPYHPITNIDWCDVTASTNDDLIQAIRQGIIKQPQARSALRQTAGRGRVGRTWESAHRAAMFSVAFPFSHSQKNLAGLSLCVGVWITDYLISQGLHRVQLKWPNDIYLFGRKLGGILIDMLAHEQQDWAVIGIGINIERPRSSLMASSAALLEMREHWSEQDLVSGMLACVEQNWELYRKFGFQPFRATWLARHMFQNQTVAIYEQDSIVVQGKVCGIGDFGELLLLTERGQQKVFSGDCSLRSLAPDAF